MSFLIWGGQTGWIGRKISALLRDAGEIVHCAESRMEYREAVERELDTIKPRFVILSAGLTGVPSIDQLESRKQETIRVNVLGTINVIDACYVRGIKVTNMATGCIYQYDATHPVGSGHGFTEEDEPNYRDSHYSATKIVCEKLLTFYDNVLTLRIRMPISDALEPRNFITKITRYEYICSIPNSMSVLHDLLPLAIDMTKKGVTGIVNFTNPGVISHNEILALYRQHIDPSFTWKNFSLEDQAKILKAGRSNNELSCTKLLSMYPHVPHIKESIIKVFERMAHNMGIESPKEQKEETVKVDAATQ